MKIASVSENKKIERRIAITPEIAKKYISLGFEVILSENYGDHLGIKDNEYKELGANGTAGVVTDIYVSKIPDVVSAGSSIGIGTESLLVLNTFNERGILRVKRGVVGAAQTLSTPVFTVPDSFDIDLITSPCLIAFDPGIF